MPPFEERRDPFAPPPPSEPEAWAEVCSRWDDDAAHRAYLARFSDLEGLAVAGGRYRAVLAERPGDAIAERWRVEVVKRATVQGLASLPRSKPPRLPARHLKRAVLLLVAALAVALAALAARLLLGATP